MPATILYRDDEMLEENNDIRGSNRIRYMPWINRIIGAERNRSDGNLKEASFKEITYDALQKFPEDQLAKILKPAQTEIATVDVISSEFNFQKVAVGVKMVISSLKSVNTANAKASIINSLQKQWDFGGYTGTHGNIGVEDNPYHVKRATAPVGDIKVLIEVISATIKDMKEMLQITDSELNGMMIGYTSGISSMMSEIYGNSSDTGMSLVKKAFPDCEFGEIPTVISLDPSDGTTQREFIEINYKPMITQHHGAVPSQYATKEGDFGLSEEALFTYESVALELEERGCITRTPVTLS